MTNTFDAQFYGERISDNQIETPEGYLICRNVKIARIGTQQYLGQEIGEDSKYDQLITVHRLPEDVFDNKTLASFEGKPVVDDHPSVGVTVHNYSNYAKGTVHKVRKDGDYIVADLSITDPILIQKVKDGLKREVSCGYNCAYEEYKNGYKQTQIIGNHVAVVERGRAGNTVRINDALSIEDIPVNKKQALLKLITHYAKDHKVEEVETLAELVFDNEKQEDTLFNKLSKMITSKDKKTKDADKEDMDDEEVEEPEAEKKENKKADDRLAKLESLVLKLVKDAEEKKEKTEDEGMGFENPIEDADYEDMDDEEVEKMKDAEEKAMKKAEDAILKRLKPALAKLPAKDQKAFLAQIRPTGNSKTYGAINKIPQSHAKKVVDTAAYTDHGMEIAKKYNPHFKEQK